MRWCSGQRARAVVFAVLVVSLVSGCGFALRGTDALPAALAITYVQADNRSAPLVREVDRQINIAGGRLTESVSDATSTLRILEDDSGERVLSLATTGGPEELEAYHLLRFELWRDGERVYGPDLITLRRDYTFDKNDVLGKRREYQTLQQSLRRNVVTTMLRRLSISPDVT